MSTEVTFRFEFIRINAEAQNKWKKMSKVWEDDFAEKHFFHREGVEDYSNDKPFGLLWLNNDEKLSAKEINTKIWNLENTGQEWTNIRELPDELGFYAYSQSYNPPYPYSFPPLKGIKWILKQLEQYDRNIISFVDYQCQELEFTGFIVLKGTRQYGGFEHSYEEIVDTMIKEYPDELSEKWDKEKKDWIDEESSEFFDENVYVHIGDDKTKYLEKINPLVETFTGDGSTTKYILSKSDLNNDNISIALNGVMQYSSGNQNSRAFHVSETGCCSLTFAIAPAQGTTIDVRQIIFADESDKL